MLKKLSALLVAGFCVAGAAYADGMQTGRIDVTQNNADTFRDVDRVDHVRTVNVDSHRGDVSDEHWRHGGDVTGEHERNLGRTTVVENSRATGLAEGPQVAGDSARIESTTQVRSDREIVAASDVKAPASGDRADRTGPVPFADLGHVGDGDKQLSTEKAIAQDKQLLVQGEIEGDDLVIHLPAGTKHDTISLRSSSGLSLSRADVARLGRWDDDCLKISLSALGRDKDNLGNLWVWGTGPESASLLQRVAMIDGSQSIASNQQDIPQRRSAGISSTLGAPLNEPNMMSGEEFSSDDQIEKEKQMQRDAGLEKSADDREEKTW